MAGDAIVSEHARHFGPAKVAMVPLAGLRAFVDGANGTCIEYEGLHHVTPEQQGLDAYRDQRVSDVGWRQVKVNSIDMAGGREWVVSRVAQALRQQGWRRRVFVQILAAGGP